MAVLVTGASGFVGTWLVRELIRRGEEVRILHRKNSPVDELMSLGAVSRLGDLSDTESLREAVSGVDTVFHLAGAIGYSRAMRQMMEEVNVRGTKNMVEAMAFAPQAKMVYMSSVVAVGASFDGVPLNENSPFNIHHLNLGYFETKHEAEKIVQDACRRGKLEAVILNPSTIYGAGDAKKGSRKTQLKVARGEIPFYTSGGVSVVSVHDIVDTVIAARNKGRNGERYILCGENITIKELFTRIAAIAGVEPPKIYLPNWAVFALGKTGDLAEKFGKKGPLNSENAWTAVLYHWFDHSRATAELGFNPRPADQALRESVEWMRDNGMLK